jgi:translocation and assembly module TamB
MVGRDTAARAARIAAGTPTDAEAPDAPVVTRGFRVQANLAIDLGDRFRVFGAGVDARLAGQVTLSGRLPDAPRLNGTVSIAQGSYTGFGQNLEIERGKLVFSGPVDNPAIDIVAYRRFLPVEAGVAISGTARFPRLTLVSKPDVPEPDKLSWLVLGMSAESSRGGQAAALQAAAVLLASGDPRAAAAPSLASTVGLDVLSVRTGASGLTSSGSASASVQDSVVTLGKRVSERLFLSYEQSLRGLQNLLRLQYEISERLSIRGRVGTENAIDLVWTKRYD